MMGKILDIAKAGERTLYEPAKKVTVPTSSEVYEHAQNMIETLSHAGGLGLAAPQVHIPLRICILNIPKTAPNPRYDFSSDPNHQEFPLTVMINPTFTPLSNERQYGWESCLSFPGLRGKVRRFISIECAWTDLQGQRYTQDMHGFNARVLQHELDHLDGILYPARIEDFSTFGFEQETSRNENDK